MFKSIIKRQLQRIKHFMLSDIQKEVKSTLILLGKIASYRLQQVEDISSLSDVEFKVYSQWGEDGILEWLIQKLPISSRRFIEFGVEFYEESNTRFLLINRNWNGLVIDADPSYISHIRNDEIYWRNELNACQAFITRDNINNLIKDNGFGGEIGVLSIDVDGNDYWIWEAIEVIKPAIVVCEYNAVLGDIYPITIPYKENFDRTLAHYSKLYWGAGIKALEWLADQNGYNLIGSNTEGINAFFIQKELAKFIEPRIKNKKPRPSLVRESHDANHGFTFLGGLKRLEIIKHLPVVRVDTGETILLDSLMPIYSEQWVNEMRGSV